MYHHRESPWGFAEARLTEFSTTLKNQVNKNLQALKQTPQTVILNHFNLSKWLFYAWTKPKKFEIYDILFAIQSLECKALKSSFNF